MFRRSVDGKLLQDMVPLRSTIVGILSKLATDKKPKLEATVTELLFLVA